MTAQITSAQDVLDDGALLAADHQRVLHDLVGEGTPYDAAHRGRYDFSLAVATLRFTGPDAPPITLRAHFVGSAAPGPGTWFWGWKNLMGFPSDVVSYAHHVREFGERYGIGELTEQEHPLRWAPREDAQRYALLAATVCGGMTTYTAEVGGGTVLAMLLDGPGLELPAPSAARVATLVPEVVSAGAVVDWRRALASYGRVRGLGVEERAGQTILRAADGDVVVSLDAAGRVSRIEGRLGDDGSIS